MKKWIFIVMLLVLTGCSATYKMEIVDDVFKEKISINSSNNDLSYFKNNKFYAIMNGASNFIEYNRKEGKNSIDFSYNYSFDNISKSTLLKSCFSAYSIIEEDNYYILSTSEGIKCATEEDRVLLDNLKVVIKTNHVVKESNENDKSNNKYEYVWNFSKDDYSKAKIYMKIYKDKYVFNYNNEITILIGVIGGLVLVILTMVIILVRKVKKANKI